MISGNAARHENRAAFFKKNEVMESMRKPTAVLITVFMMIIFAVNVHAADALQGTWANSSGGVSYVFDGNGKGLMRHANHVHDIAYTIDGKNLKISFPNEDGHGLSDNFTFEAEGDLLKLTIAGKTAAQRYERKPDDWTPPEWNPPSNSQNQQKGQANDPNDPGGSNGDMFMWLITGGAGGTLLTAVICIIVTKKKLRKARQEARRKTI